MSKNRLYSKMLRLHLFSIFTIKTPRALTALTPLGLLIVKTLTNELLTITSSETPFVLKANNNIP